jgi:pyruvate dehydrogenase E2 component (dihydrolipoamide acetyltransferase)
MALSVVMPALEMAQETGKLVSWLKKEGEQVRKGDMLLEVETDKAVVEIEAAGDGVLGGITAREGDVIPVGRTIAWLLQPGESPPVGSVDVQSGRTGTGAAATGNAASGPAATSSRAAPPASASAPRVSPKARRLAQQHGVDLTQVKGSGPGGEILADDILAAADSRRSPGPPPVEADLEVRLTTVGRLMAERTTQSWTTVPHFFLTRDVDASALNAARERQLPAVEKSHGVRVSHTDLLVAAVCRALRKHPRMNASFAGDGIRLNDDINIALAMAVEHAVVTAVIPRADVTALGDIAARRRELADRARDGKLQPHDIAGATFTISNLGMFGVDAFTAIIVPPQAGILAVGAIADRVVALNGQPAVRPMMTLTLSSDHRVADGATAAAFLADVVAALADPLGT